MLTYRRMFQGLVALMVMGLVANWWMLENHSPHAFDLDIYVYYAVAAAALTVPVFWAVTHLCGGVLFGIAAGGFFDGVKLGLTLGVGMALGKMWPHVAAFAAGVYLGGGPLIYSVGAGVLAVTLFALDKALQYFWDSTTAGRKAP